MKLVPGALITAFGILPAGWHFSCQELLAGQTALPGQLCEASWSFSGFFRGSGGGCESVVLVDTSLEVKA